jgi:Spy/CpxP family protein refolding chaperone
MSDHGSEGEMPAASAQGVRSRRRGPYIVVAVAGVALLGAFAISPHAGQLGQRMLAHVPHVLPGMTADAAPFDGPASWGGGLFDTMIEAVVEDRADRMVRHLSIEIDATAEQQEKLRAIVRDAVKDLLPMREKIMSARATARDLLTQQTVDRAAIEKFRTEMIATHDAVSKRLVQAVADAAEVLTPEQRRRISDMVAAHRGGPWGGRSWGGGSWGRGPWGHFGGWRN